jgi:BirA family biotin operon repressor/biotin-[acetyl-CoA-carboxylase] ligase
MRIRIVERTGSTNSDLIADRNAVEGSWLVALEQHAGKGRQGRQWVSAKGNFAGSTLVELRDDDPPAQTLSLAAGLALADAIDVASPGQPLMLKWPNDLLLRDSKLAGILLERSGDRIAVGFGVNLAAAPALVDRRAADLGGAILPEAFAPLLAASFARMLDSWRASESSALTRAWEERAHPLVTRLTVNAGAGETI